MPKSVQYVTDEQGRVGLLDLEAYSQLVSPLALDAECLIGLSVDELRALASCKLAMADQARLDELVIRNTESAISTDEVDELDRLLSQADQLTIHKTRAVYTLKRLEDVAIAS